MDDQKSVPDIKMEPLAATNMADTIGASHINEQFVKYLEGLFNTITPYLDENRQVLPPNEREEHRKTTEEQIRHDKRKACRDFETIKAQYTGESTTIERVILGMESLSQEISNQELIPEPGVIRLSEYI